MNNVNLFLTLLLAMTFRATAQRSTYSDSVTTIQFVGNGNIQKSLTNGDEIPANTGLGVIYRETMKGKSSFKWLYNFELAMYINVASTVDTLKADLGAGGEAMNRPDFGNSILLPSNSGQSFSIAFKGYFDRFTGKGNPRADDPAPICGIFSGFYVNLTGANRNWSYNDTYVKAGMISSQVGVFHDFVDRDTRNQGYSIVVGLGYTSRFLLGDIAQRRNGFIREHVLGTRSCGFHGAEMLVAITLKNIRASVRIPYLYCKDQVPGLSGVQPNTFVGFVGGFSLEL